MIVNTIRSIEYAPDKRFICPFCGDINIRMHEKYYCYVCNKCFKAFSYL